MKPALHSLPRSRPRHRQRGATAVLLLLLIGGALALAALASDGTRMTADAAQLKRATDAAALAAAMARVREDDTNLQALAERYVNANLGMDTAQLGNRLAVRIERIEVDGDEGVRVSATFRAESMLASMTGADVTVASAAVARNKPLEIALALPSTLNENAANLAVLRRLGKTFARRVLDSDRRPTWLSLVPYSQSVNVYDAGHVDRIRSWATAGALSPVELTSLFRSGYSNLADRRMPDRRANLLCMYRGLNEGENYRWQSPPSGQFGIYYRADLPENGSPGAPPISWVGPNPGFGAANGLNDTRWMVADRGCPSAPLLPLTKDLDAIDARLDALSTRFNVNYAIAMGWSAMALAPAFRGGAGWGLDDDLPKDFDDGSGKRLKAIVFLVNSSDQRWFDSDSYNGQVGQAIDGGASTGTGAQDSVITRRFANLCASFRTQRLRFFLIVTGNDESTDENGRVTSASDFRRLAGTALDGCAEKPSDQLYLSGADFVASEGAIADRLDVIADTLRREASLAQLIE